MFLSVSCDTSGVIYLMAFFSATAVIVSSCGWLRVVAKHDFML
jgi:hypothetical protein